MDVMYPTYKVIVHFITIMILFVPKQKPCLSNILSIDVS